MWIKHIMSALPPIADIRQCRWDIREMPKGDIVGSIARVR
jgi:hypothetical protein